jgi:glycosyltransferase involved in cell wall biosynthesis
MSPPRLTIIVPALNEERHLSLSVKEGLRAADAAAIACEVIIVDDGSTDGTLAAAEGLAASDARIRVVRNPRNMGLGGAYKAGLALARGEFVTWIPADASHPSDGLIPAYGAIGEADMILPRPTNPQVRATGRRIISSVYTFLVNSITGLRIPYYNGLAVHRAELLRSVDVTTDSFGFQAEAITKLVFAGASYRVVDAAITERQLGRTKAFRIKNVVAVWRTLLHILMSSRRRVASDAQAAGSPAQGSTQAGAQSQK